jgi:hypothetical protein
VYFLYMLGHAICFLSVFDIFDAAGRSGKAL